MMPTISELVAQHSKVPGDIRVRQNDWLIDHWFQPYFAVGDVMHGLYHRRDKKHDSDGFDSTSVDVWELYTEPKPKVKRAQYLIQYPEAHLLPVTSPAWYRDDAEFLKWFSPPAGTKHERLTEREFER